MQVFVYGSERREETFIYLPKHDGFDSLPQALRDTLGELRFVIDFDLQPGRRLARVDGDEVLGSIAARGFYLQLAPHPATDKRHPN